MEEVRSFDPAAWRRGVAAIEADLRRLASLLSEAQLHAPPRSGGWSVGYCIEHLILTGNCYLPRWDEALSHCGTHLVRQSRRSSYSWWQRELLRCTRTSSRLKRKAPAPSVPYTRRSLDHTIAAFLQMHSEVERRVEESDRRNLAGVKVQSPFSSWLHYPMGFSFDLLLAHERRHFEQAWRLQRLLASTH